MHIEGGRFVVTGGASLIGSHLTQQLLEAGAAAVILFDNYALGSPEVAASLAQDRRVTAIRGDITRLPELLDALDQVDGVFALAGFLTLPLSQNPGLGLEVNVLGMYNLVEACRYRGVKKVVFASSVATYGNPEADEVDERTPFSWQTCRPRSRSMPRARSSARTSCACISSGTGSTTWRCATPPCMASGSTTAA